MSWNVLLLYINEDMISRIAERTNEQMRKVCERINADEFQFCYSDTNELEIKCLFRLLQRLIPRYKTTNERTLVCQFFCKESLLGCNLFKQIRVVNEENNISSS